ncbi:DUF1707 domain-containing protein [Nocardia sp. NBC_00565]|uniref:DUF1707 SHOCT-like domain-containing protein n=1 Tax=Nocardia sp. NBC_00565 TaxID=2975993 RepID=UPI002E81EDCF|nr:DUF1707 domain-containing protein [Nocardia sp. NBC_00565]WUC02249.1 DUF1707 domain-containing protein [Nocardia sp. NBC_00565]
MATTRYSGIRARDTDRADVCGLLDAALADGQLTEGEHADRTAKAMRAKAFGELDQLIGDLQVPQNLVDAPVIRVDRRRPRRWIAPVAFIAGSAIIGAAAGGIAGCAGGTIGLSEHLPVLTTGTGLAYFIDEYRAEFGDTQVDDVTVYPSYVIFERRAAGDPTATARYRYNGSFHDYSASSGRRSDVRSFDLASIDQRAIAGLLAGAPQSVRLPDTAITHVSLEFPPGGSADRPPVVVIHVTNKANSTGVLTTTFTGEPLTVSPPTR